MKRHIYVMTCVTGTVLLAASAAAVGRSPDALGVLLARIQKTSSIPAQSRYSLEVQKSVNAAAVQDMVKTCAHKHPGSHVRTFTLLGTMRMDGLLKGAIPVPDNAFTGCIADKIGSTHFPLPPGNGKGWPLGIQFDGTTGRALHMAGDRQSAMPLYQSSTMTSMHWAYTPIPVIPEALRKACVASVWLTVGGHGRVETADIGDSSCTSALNNAVLDAARQWLKSGAPGSASDDSVDVRVSFNIARSGIRVKL